MGITNNAFYINNISIIYYSDRKKHVVNFGEKEMTLDNLEYVKELICSNSLERLELKNTKIDLSMTVFYEKGIAHIGIIDMYNDIVYYYTNGSNDPELVAIAGNMFENNMICKDNGLLYDMINYFVLNGKPNPDVEWIEE